jgi:ABC-type branched-subunit amino acid transport system ATPase component/ABC-type branched-subunit amino acid transport system permease subunit
MHVTTMVLALALPKQVAFSGLVNGATYGIMAVGIILVYRSTRVINFAVAAMGGLAAALLARMVINWNVSYWPAFAVCVIVGGAIGWLVDRVVIRRLFNAPRVIVFVATIGVAQLLVFGQAVLPRPSHITGFPTPSASSWTVFGVDVQGAHVAILIVVPLLTAALAVFLNRTKYGIAVRASAANADAARLAGIDVQRMSSLVWVLAGLLAAVGTILSAPITTTTSSDILILGPGLLVRVLVAAVIARMSSLGTALVTGIAIGVGESLLYYNRPNDHGILDLALLVVLLVALVPLASRRGSAETVESGFSFTPRVPAIPSALARTWYVRRLPELTFVAGLVAALAPLFIVHGASQQQLWSSVLLSAIIALSLTVLTGWSGQLSLGQFAFVGLGAMTTAALVTRGVGFAPALAAAAIVGGAVAVLVGAPALRVPGLYLAVTTLAFAVATGSWLLSRSFFVGSDQTVTMPRAVVGSFSLSPERTYYVLCLIALVVCVVAVARIRRSGFGRSLIGARDNERSLAAFGLSPARVKVTAFAISGVLAGFAGGLLGGLYVTFGPDRFSATGSLQAVAMVVIGGLASVTGAVVGALVVVGLPVLFSNNANVALLTSGAGILVVLLIFPGGIAQVFASLRDEILVQIARRREPAADATKPAPQPELLALGATARALPTATAARRKASAGDATGPVLVVAELSVRFGSQIAVDGVDLEVRPGEIVGLIGSNGAGKSTIMNAIGGFVPSDGTISVFGSDVAGLAPARRARLGLGRTFQGADLFSDLDVRETIMLALEVGQRAGIPSIVLGLPHARRAERAKQARADEIIAFLGLDTVAARFVDELSTGTRRIVELACLVASGTRILCLDEPTAGLAQRESEAFVPMLANLRRALDASILIIEHDMSVAMEVSDRMYCLESGRIIREGLPDDVRNDPVVIESYLGAGVRSGRVDKAIRGAGDSRL